MDYTHIRKDILQYLNALQRKGFSYQSICDYINSQQTDFVLFKDFFSRFLSKPNHFRSSAKQKKFSQIHHHLQDFYQQNLDEGDSVNDLFIKLISTASAVKFEALLEVNRSAIFEHSGLSDYYLQNGPALHSIENNLKHKTQYGWELDIHNLGSTFKILSIQTSNLFTKSAVVTTKEFWKLCWVDKQSKLLQFKYESLGEQTYLLSKDKDDNWKVIENMTKALINKLSPEYIDYTLLNQLSSTNREENKLTASKFLSENKILTCIEFMKTVYSDKLPLNQVSILNRIRESCLNSHRLLNTNIINFSMFKSEIELLNIQAKLVCDSIFLTNK